MRHDRDDNRYVHNASHSRRGLTLGGTKPPIYHLDNAGFFVDVDKHRSASIPELGRGLIGRPAASKALDHKELRSLAVLGMRLVAALARFESPFKRVGVPCGPRFDERMFVGCRDEAG